MTIDECILDCVHYTSTDICKYESIYWGKEQIKQIAEWLEELKAYKQKPEGWMWDEAERKGYNKAIDDFVKSFKNLIEDESSNPILMSECKKLGVWKNYDFEKIAKQLKVGGENE